MVPDSLGIFVLIPLPVIIPALSKIPWHPRVLYHGNFVAVDSYWAEYLMSAFFPCLWFSSFSFQLLIFMYFFRSLISFKISILLSKLDRSQWGNSGATWGEQERQSARVGFLCINTGGPCQCRHPLPPVAVREGCRSPVSPVWNFLGLCGYLRYPGMLFK